MATTTTNYGYNISEGTDLVNPLTDIFPNFTAIDGDLKSVSDEAITTATELKTGTVHALTRSDADREAIRFTATSNFTAGETFTVDGTQVTALTTSGEALTTGAYIIGSEVFCILKGTLLTMFVSQNITDADTLNGHDSTYFATDADMTQAEDDITALSTKVGTAVLTTTAQDCSGAINELNTDLSAKASIINLWTNSNPSASFSAQTIELSSNDYDVLIVPSSHGSCTQIKGHDIWLYRAGRTGNNPENIIRQITYIDDTHLSVGNATTNSGVTSNTYLIPYAVYGVKLS